MIASPDEAEVPAEVPEASAKDNPAAAAELVPAALPSADVMPPLKLPSPEADELPGAAPEASAVLEPTAELELVPAALA